MALPRLVVFAYNFPHLKTQSFLVELKLLGYAPMAVIAAPRVSLKHGERVVRSESRDLHLHEPGRVAERLGFPFFVAPHGSATTVELLGRLKPDLGLISGARLLPVEVLEAFTLGVVNFHPGLLPVSRGLDSLLWDIVLDRPVGVTAHLIDGRMDAGRLIMQRTLPEYDDDTLIDMKLRAEQVELSMIEPVLHLLATVGGDLPPAYRTEDLGRARGRMSASVAAAIPSRLQSRRRVR
jgi:methionyl-tRNA formyltransferase